MNPDPKTKYAVVLPDGAADEPVDELEGRTPLEAARTPNIDWISTHGRQGRVVTVPEGFTPGSDVATLTLFGYDVREVYPGRAPLEAAARGITVRHDQVVFRCNLVTIVDGLMADFTAGHMSQPEADQLIAALNESLSDRGCHFYSGVSYRNLVVASNLGDVNPRCTPPHDIPDQPVSQHQPTGPGASWVLDVSRRAHEILATHDVNVVRGDLGDNPATDIWLWGSGRPQPLTPFHKRYDLHAAAIAAVDLIRGIAKTLRIAVLDVPGATGYLDTNYAGKGAAAVEALNEFDLVVVHIEAPDEAGHLGDGAAKVEAIERIDEHVVGPVLEALRKRDKWRILIAPDHPTPVGKRVHTSTPPPFCMAGERIQTVLARPLSEANAALSDLQIDPGHELMEYFLKS
jgi:2,3-bisphosphoglycerate-independent phosphoglycerate mutase